MFWCETGGETPRDYDALALFVAQLAAAGAPAVVDSRGVPDGLSRYVQFELAPYLREGPPEGRDTVVVVGAHRLTDGRLARLRRLAGPSGRRVVALGAFETRQAVTGVKARLSYVFGQDPVTRESGEEGGDWPDFGVAPRVDTAARPRLLLLAPDLGERAQASALMALALSPRLDVAVLTDGKSKQEWQAAHGAEIPFYQFAEATPASLAARIDICVAFGSFAQNPRARALIANLALGGATLIDATPGHAGARASDAFVRGPLDLLALGPFISAEILPNLRRIAERVRGSRFAAARDAGSLLRLLEAPARPSRRRSEPVGGRILFNPTNGVGLGHAQRCVLVAGALASAPEPPVFAAFPSCSRLIKAHGFDVMPLIGRSGQHTQSHENDLANYVRLRALARDARTLVFDGGYVFDSVYRVILERRLRGVWIRRGLWQASQDNSVALDREKVFDRVIVPGEAFEELNETYSRGDHVRLVGPIVQRLTLDPARRADLRARLAERFGLPFERLVVTLLGAGVAADRGAQLQALCGMMERRTDVLHLILVWPTAVLQPVWLGWSRSRVVKTHSAGVLAAAADFCVGAAGYNFFHETLYNRVPAVFVPQTGSYMDDQRARARAAHDRGLAGLAEPSALMVLEREVGRFLDGGAAEQARTRLAALELPAPGVERAPRLIEEVSNGPAALERDPVADYPA